MPSYDFECEDKHYTERFMKMSEMVSTTPCGTCGKPAKRIFITLGQARDAQPIDPVIVYRKLDGGYIYPGNSTPREYEGAVRMELRTMGELRAVSREQDRLDREYWELTRQREEEVHGPARRARREQLMANLHSNLGRDFARLAMAQLDARRNGRTYSPASYFEVMELDRSNREAQYDASTGWKGRRD